MTGPRQRDLETLPLSKQCRDDIAELEKLRKLINHYSGVVDEFNKARLKIWKRRDQKGDLKRNELARLSGVSGPYVTKELGK